MELRLLNHALRYTPVVSMLEGADGGALLEVGSGSRGIAAYLSRRWEITACDLSFDDFGAANTGGGLGARRVTASVIDLPFDEGSYDTVVALDLLEHVPPADRTAALRELRRVARRQLIVGCPCGDEAEMADRRFAEYLRRHRRTIPVWLREHIEHGLPRAEDLQGAARPRDRTIAFPNATAEGHLRVLRWESTPLLWRLTAAVGTILAEMTRHGGRSRQIAERISNVIRGHDREPTYRQIVCIFVDEREP